MQVIYLSNADVSLLAASNHHRQVLAIGDFDGVHLGHSEVIRRAAAAAAERKLPAAVMTFHPHPREVLGHAKYAESLTPLEHRLELFSELGVQLAYVVKFDEALMKLSPQSFVERFLHPLGLDTVIVGFDFTFGHLGQGTPDTLVRLANDEFAVDIVCPYQIDGCKVSSTAIRDALERGDVRHAAHLLGRPYSIRGTVIHGDARGRTIGFPTANVLPNDAYVLPALGVYAIRAAVDDQIYAGVMNLGVKPTFAGGEKKPSLEAHLFDFNRDIYGRNIEIYLITYLRGERKFSSVQELVQQISRDSDEAKSHLLSH